MAQGVLPYKYEVEKTASGMTALAGLPVYLDLAWVFDVHESIARHLHVKVRGWTDQQIVLALMLLNIAGGDAVSDIDILEKDQGFSTVLGRIETKGFSRQQRRVFERRWRKEKHRSVPSQSAVFRFLEAFHDPEEEKKREKGKALIPSPNEHLLGLRMVNRDLVASVQRRRPLVQATLDCDATVKRADKENALFSYKGYRAYQPFNVWWAETQLVLHSEFRDGNVPAGYEQLRVFKEALDMLPEGVTTVFARSDTAGYQHDFLKYCEKGENRRFGRIEFAIGTDVTKEFRKAVAEAPEWQPVMKEIDGEMVPTTREWAEVCFIPNEIAYSRNAPTYRYLATREPLKQESLPTVEQLAFPFPTMKMDMQNYKIFGIVTNRSLPGNEIVNWLYTRCGKSEEAHSIMKEDLAGGHLPSSLFGANAAWWAVMVLAFNLNSAMKSLVLQGSWVPKRMKALRFHLINLPGRVMEGARELRIRLAGNHPSLDLLIGARRRIMELTYAPSG
jgi:hypothetical protein